MLKIRIDLLITVILFNNGLVLLYANSYGKMKECIKEETSTHIWLKYTIFKSALLNSHFIVDFLNGTNVV